MSYGERFRLLRERNDLTQEQVARALKYKRAAPVSLLERKSTKVPRPRTIQKHALALACQPWELLAGVPTDYDWLRTPQPLTNEEMAALLLALAYLPPSKRRPVIEMFEAFLETLPTDAAQKPKPSRAPGISASTSRTHRGKKRA